MDPSLVAAFWLVAFSLACTPGADWAYAISAGLRSRRVAPSIAGMVVGYLVVIVIVAVGVGALVTRVPVVLTVLTIAGAGYLVWLGVTTLVRPAPVVEAAEVAIAGDGRREFLRGAGVSGINPKGLLLLLALLPQFTTAAGWPPTAQMLVLGGLHLVDCAVVYTIVALLARRLLRARPRASAVVTKVAGVAMTTIGALLLVEQGLALLPVR